jgi:8-oxo-dGTP pyrophosphatase MutT (NUDIX family)
MVVQIPISVAVLVRDGLVLLVHRQPSHRWYPDCGDLVGGHVEAGELPHQAVSRECLEEPGAQVHNGGEPVDQHARSTAACRPSAVVDPGQVEGDGLSRRIG